MTDEQANELRDRIARLPRYTEDDAYKAGLDCGANGANEKNCHFAYFSTPEKTRAWERGKAEGESHV